MTAKVHTNIGHDRALCGVNPNRGTHTVVSNAMFFNTPQKDRCQKCARHLKQRGYHIALPPPRHSNMRGARS
jgi:hypothetical protein